METIKPSKNDMTPNQKANRVLEMLEELNEMFPGGNASISAHHVDVWDLDTDKWHVDAMVAREYRRVILTAKPTDIEAGGITLFGETND